MGKTMLSNASCPCCEQYGSDRIAHSAQTHMVSALRCHVLPLQLIWSLENEREARGQEATEASQRHAQALEEVKLRDMAAADLQKKVTKLTASSVACKSVVCGGRCPARMWLVAKGAVYWQCDCYP